MFEGSIQKKEGLSWTTSGPGKNGKFLYLSIGGMSKKLSLGEEKLISRRQGKRGNSFALVNYRKCCQEQTAVCSAGTDIFENRLCPYHNGEEL